MIGIFPLKFPVKFNGVVVVGTSYTPKFLLKKFLELLPNVVAGGGKVLNSEGRILFIFRNGKWDLPKGKAENKETIDQTALREVEEETGVEMQKFNLKMIDGKEAFETKEEAELFLNSSIGAKFSVDDLQKKPAKNYFDSGPSLSKYLPNAN